jgi:hypothetical protein
MIGIRLWAYGLLWVLVHPMNESEHWQNDIGRAKLKWLNPHIFQHRTLLWDWTQASMVRWSVLTRAMSQAHTFLPGGSARRTVTMHVREQRDKLILHEIHHGQEEGMFVSQYAAVAALLHTCHCSCVCKCAHACLCECVCVCVGGRVETKLSFTEVYHQKCCYSCQTWETDVQSLNSDNWWHFDVGGGHYRLLLN